jgi:hypothetical protein
MTRAELDPVLKHALAGGTPVEVVDPATNEVYYLLSAEQFSKLGKSTNSEIDPTISYPMIDLIMADDDASDPLLDSYQ